MMDIIFRILSGNNSAVEYDLAKVGVVTENCELALCGFGGREVVRGSLERLKAAWQAPLANI